MHAFYVLVCITTVSSLVGGTEEPFKGLKINIFSSNDKTQASFLESFKEIEDKFDSKFQNKEGVETIENVSEYASKIPYVGEVFEIASKIIGMALSDGDLETELKAMIEETAIKSNVISDIVKMQRKLYLDESWKEFTNSSSPNAQKHVVDVYKDLQEMLFIFSDFVTPSYQKWFPLISSEFLIPLSLAVAAFEPIAIKVMPVETRRFALPCLAHDLLVDYRSYAVDARLDKLSFQEPDTIVGIKNEAEMLVAIKNEPYNPDGYNPESCDSDGSKVNQIDEFSANGFATANTHCRIGYAKHVRHLVEKMFPVKQLGELCDKRWPLRVPSGYGYLTINFKKVKAVQLKNEKKCDYSFSDDDCDSYVELSINNEEVFDTKSRDDAKHNTIEKVFTSIEIPRNSTIKIEVLDADNGSPDTIMTEEGDIDSFLKNPVRIDPKYRLIIIPMQTTSLTYYEHNTLNTAVFWKDTYSFIECVDQPMVDHGIDFNGKDLGKEYPKICTSSKLYQKNERLQNPIPSYTKWEYSKNPIHIP